MAVTFSTCDVSTASRALNYGDGFFTTIAVIARQLQLFPLHSQRLIANAKSLSVDLTDIHLTLPSGLDSQHLNANSAQYADFDAALQVIFAACCKQHPEPDFVIKVLIARGDGGRGYSPHGCGPTQVIVTTHHYPLHYQQQRKEGISVEISNVKLAHQPLLAGLKHLNRLEQVLVKQDLQARDCDDLLVADYQDNLIEASAANFFWMNESSTWCTPVLDHCGIDGVFRQHIIAHMTASGQKVTEKPCRIEDLLAAKALFICNSLMQVVPVTELRVKGQTIAIADTPVIALQNQLGLTQ